MSLLHFLSSPLVSHVPQVSQEDIEHVIELCNQIVEISEYREQLDEYLKTRMMAIAPNLTEMVGVLIGARLIARAGQILSLSLFQYYHFIFCWVVHLFF
jgi:nucleolar protein 58